MLDFMFVIKQKQNYFVLILLSFCVSISFFPCMKPFFSLYLSVLNSFALV